MAKVPATSMPSTARVRDDQWRIPDALWERIEPLLPPRPPHPLGCHNPRVPDRKAMDAIFFVLRTGCHWNALNVTGICSSSAARRRFQEWTAAGVFVTLWAHGLEEYDALKGLDWEWLAMDGAMTKAPLGGVLEPWDEGPEDREGPVDGRRAALLLGCGAGGELDGRCGGGEYECGSSPMRDPPEGYDHPGVYRRERALLNPGPTPSESITLGSPFRYRPNGRGG